MHTLKIYIKEKVIDIKKIKEKKNIKLHFRRENRTGNVAMLNHIKATPKYFFFTFYYPLP